MTVYKVYETFYLKKRYKLLQRHFNAAITINNIH